MAEAQHVEAAVSVDNDAIIADMHRVLAAQKKATIEQGPPSLKQRQDLLDRVIAMTKEYTDQFVEALNADFGSRSKVGSLASDIYGVVNDCKHAKKNLPKWMRAKSTPTSFPFNLIGGKSTVEYTPFGTVGVISPWNFPVYLTFAPLASIFAAGNRVMIKTSELTPASSALMKEAVEKYFDELEMAVFEGGPAVGQAFTSLHLDHLLYTGGGAIAKHVMKAAAENLVPVTLELGGKSPVIIGKDTDLDVAAKRVMFGKTFNAGQICLAPDYALVPKNQMDDFVEATKRAVTEYFPDLKHNEDYTAIINDKHFQRINGLVDDAREKGAEVIEINPASEDFEQQPHRKIPPTIVKNVTDDMAIMNEEIFGPVLPVQEYDDNNIDEAIGVINAKDKPLGLYYFGNDKKEQRHVLDHTHSGGVTVNDVISHIQQPDLPFGGVGPSGIGYYMGEYGYQNFSHLRSVYKQSTMEAVVGMLRPPYGNGKAEKTIRSQI